MENENCTENSDDFRCPTPARLNQRGLFVDKILRLNLSLHVFLLSKIMCEINTWKRTLMNYTYVQSFLVKEWRHRTHISIRFLLSVSPGGEGGSRATRRLLFSTQVKDWLTNFGQTSVQFMVYPFCRYIYDNQINQLPFGVFNNNLELTHLWVIN